MEPSPVGGQSSSLTKVNLTNLQPIPVLCGSRREMASGPRPTIRECNNNMKKEQCRMCVTTNILEEEQLAKHMKEHYDAMFKCSVCRRGFEALSDATRHQDKHHGSAAPALWPAGGEMLLAARCKIRGCKRHIAGVTGDQIEEHFRVDHGMGEQKAAARRSRAVEWSCRLCSNSGRRFVGEKEALCHAEGHCRGEQEEDDSSDTSSGGFSSVSSWDGASSEESSESDRMTELSEESGALPPSSHGQ